MLSTTAFLSSCKNGTKGTDPQPEPDTYLVSSTQIATVTKDQAISQATQLLGSSAGSYASLLAGLIKNNVSVYKLIYNTKLPDGTAVKASGALLVPTGSSLSFPLISQQHGTITSDADAPSNYGPGSDAASAGTFFSALGYIIACPDYIGYGESNTVPHTYEHREGLATASLDMLRAAKEFIKQNNVKWNNQLLLTGYSEGGYATMSLQKKIEEEFPTEFNLKASSMGAGAYDKTAFMEYIINQPTGGVASSNRLYLWVLQTYNNLYANLKRPMSYYLKEPYATQAQQNGMNININTSISTIFTDSFKQAINNGTDKEFLAAMKDNDVYDWKPSVPTRLFHGTADSLVFYFNSQNAYDAMTKRGAPDVQLIPVPRGTHSSSISTYLLQTYTFFSTLQ